MPRNRSEAAIWRLLALLVNALAQHFNCTVCGYALYVIAHVTEWLGRLLSTDYSQHGDMAQSLLCIALHVMAPR